MNQAIVEKLCLHCGSSTNAESTFCCAGCESVHSLLKTKDLLGFYDTNKGARVQNLRVPLPAELQASFYVEGIHCLGCLWILEKIPEILPSVKFSSLNFSTHILRVEVNNKEVWPEVLQVLQQLGYRATLLEKENDAEKLDRRAQLIRIGVAAFCTGNIMTLSASVYAGADSLWKVLFPWLSFVLFLPVFFYSAAPIYRSALSPLLFRKISVDLPVALAIFAGFLLSTWNLISGSGDHYFDSLSMLVFLLLSSRFLLQQVRLKLGKDARFLSFQQQPVQKIFPTASKVDASELQVGDWIELVEGDSLPVDGTLRSELAYFNTSLLTGESLPSKFRYGDRLNAGFIPHSKIQLEVVETAKQSRLAKILDQIHYYRMDKSPSIAYADRLGKIFLYTVLTLSFLLVAYFWNSPQIGIERSLALMIVTCPCVLAFAIPLSFTRAIQIAGSKGILLKNPEKIEDAAGLRTIFFDKTGTITTGDFSVLSWKNHEEDSRFYSIAYGLERDCPHPVAKAIVRHVRNLDLPAATLEAIVSKSDGREGFFEGTHWSIHRLKDSPHFGENWVGLFRNQQLVATIHLGDQIHQDSKHSLDELRKMGYRLILLSGDRKENVESMAKQFGFSEFYSQCSPEQKAEIVRKQSPCIMVGDGANDTVAFSAASIGIAVQGAMDLSMKNADVVFTKPGLEPLLAFLRIAAATRQTVRNNFAFSVSYNFLAGALAIVGWMTPLWAAVFMPLSALTVFLHTYWKTEKWR